MEEATAVFPHLSPYSNDPKDCLSPPGGGMLGWGKGRGCVPQPHGTEKAPSLSALAGNESLQPYLSKVHFQGNCSGSHKLWRPSDFQTKAKVR